MKTLTPALVLDNCRREAADWEELLAGPGPALESALHLATLFRMQGIAALFSTGMPRPFFESLSCGARAFARAQQRMAGDAKSTARFHPFLDAVACEDGGAIGHILGFIRRDMNRDLEYPEDFLYAMFLMGTRTGASEEERAGFLGHWSELEPGPDARFGICQALHRGDSGAFNRLLAELMEQQLSEWEEQEDRGLLEEEEGLTVARLSVEGLALARLAERIGMEVDSAFPLMPPAARIGRYRGPRPWQEDAGTAPPWHRDRTGKGGG